MTLTTERQQFEKWWETAMHNGYPPRFGWEHWRDGDGYRDDDGEFQGLWQAWQASRGFLANREAQPVGFRYRHNDTVSWLYNDWRWPDSVEAEQCQIEWLYTAPPAPAVPPEIPLTSPVAAEYVAGWNACRAAMLAQPVSSGYKLPESWIACSEQTPVADGAYWCWFGKDKPSVIQQRVCIWNDRNHEWCDSAVTHWMPLPVAPEGGNGA
ncbi:TPA: DUF551 domain-containing protein [Serratia marcescens]